MSRYRVYVTFRDIATRIGLLITATTPGKALDKGLESASMTVSNEVGVLTVEELPFRDCQEAGFTLIELMITVVIIGTLAGIGITGFHSVVANAQMVAETQSLINTLHGAKAQATAGPNYIDVKINAERDSYEVWAVPIYATGARGRKKLREHKVRWGIDLQTATPIIRFYPDGRGTIGEFLLAGYKSTRTVIVPADTFVARPKR